MGLKNIAEGSLVFLALAGASLGLAHIGTNHEEKCLLYQGYHNWTSSPLFVFDEQNFETRARENRVPAHFYAGDQKFVSDLEIGKRYNLGLKDYFVDFMGPDRIKSVEPCETDN